MTKSFGSQIRGGESSCRVRLSTRPVLQPRRHARRRRRAQLGGLPEVRRRAARRRQHDRHLRRARPASRPTSSRSSASRRPRSFAVPIAEMAQHAAGHRHGQEHRRARAARRLVRHRPRGAPARASARSSRRRAPKLVEANERAFAAGVAVRRTSTRCSDAASPWRARRQARAASCSPTATTCARRPRSSPAASSSAAIRSRRRPRSCSSSRREIWKYGGAVLQAEDEIAGIGAARRRVVRRQEGDDRDLRPRHVAQDRDPGPGHDRRAAARRRQRAARRPVDRHADQARAVGSLPGRVLGARRRAAPGARADHRRRHVRASRSRRSTSPSTTRRRSSILSDQEIAQRKEIVDPIDTSRFAMVERRRPSGAELEDYARFRVTDSGISPISHPGMPGGNYHGAGHRAQRARRADGERRHARADEREALPQARAARARARDLFRDRGRRRRAARARQLGQHGRRRAARRSRCARATRASRVQAARAVAALSRWPRRSTASSSHAVRAGLVVEQSHQGQLYRILRMFVDVPAGVRVAGAPRRQPVPARGDRRPRARARSRAAARAGRRPADRRSDGDTCTRSQYQAKDYKSDLKPIWCPGCGDFGVRAGASTARSPPSAGRRTRSPSSPASAARAASPATRPRTASTACTAARCRSRRASSSPTPTCSCWSPAATATASRSAAATCRTRSAATSTSPTS